MFAPAVMRAFRKNKTLRYGVPMLLLIVGGSFGLREFSQIRYDVVKIKMDPELGKKLKENKISLESEYETPSLMHSFLACICCYFWITGDSFIDDAFLKQPVEL
uniref:Cytochrome c oxidase assembly protein COX16 homolog, mitochondrial n=1 Tax=Macaca nemestrina TaxID=9545 RepID=A0A2K6D4D9_MACNE